MYYQILYLVPSQQLVASFQTTCRRHTPVVVIPNHVFRVVNFVQNAFSGEIIKCETRLANLDETKSPARFWLPTPHLMAQNFVGSKNNLLHTSSGLFGVDGHVKRA
jgi:hypothetical protein